jgi:hypothetical protein
MELGKGEAERRQATRSERLAAILKRKFGATAFDLHIFPLSAIQPPESSADLRMASGCCRLGLAFWNARSAASFIASPATGRGSGFGACRHCCLRDLFPAAGTPEELTEMVGEAIGGVAAAGSRQNSSGSILTLGTRQRRSQMGGERAYSGQLRKDRSLRHTRRSQLAPPICGGAERIDAARFWSILPLKPQRQHYDFAARLNVKPDPSFSLS